MGDSVRRPEDEGDRDQDEDRCYESLNGVSIVELAGAWENGGEDHGNKRISGDVFHPEHLYLTILSERELGVLLLCGRALGIGLNRAAIGIDRIIHAPVL